MGSTPAAWHSSGWRGSGRAPAIAEQLERGGTGRAVWVQLRGMEEAVDSGASTAACGRFCAKPRKWGAEERTSWGSRERRWEREMAGGSMAQP
jgi:hypothetical protein